VRTAERFCCAPGCASPRGPAYDATGVPSTRRRDVSAWRLVSCESCGGQSVPVGCARLDAGEPKWRCDDCGPLA